MRITDAQRGLDFQLLLAQGVAKREGGRPKNKNKNKKRVKKRFQLFQWDIYNRRIKFYHGNYRTAL